MKSSMKSIFQVLSANVLVTIIGVVQTLILPFILTPIDYGYWSLYLLFVSYAGFLILGFCDGFYLKYGGEKYESLDKGLFSSFHLILVVYLLIVFMLWVSSVSIFLSSDEKYIVFLMIGFGGVLFCLRSYYILLNQATARFSIYAKGSVIEKVVILIVALVCLFVPNVNSYYIIASSIIGKLITVIYFAYFSRDIVFYRPVLNRGTWISAIDNVKVGFTLTLSGVGTMLITGFGRFVVENQLGIIELGYYSFVFSITILFTQLIYAISTVLFPILRRIKEVLAKRILENLDQLLINLSGIILILYYPSRYLLEMFFPKYQPAMDLMLYLFPMIISQNRMMLVYNTLYKVLRFEKQLFKNVLIALSFSVIVTILFFWKSGTMESIALATYIGIFFWNFLSVNYYRKEEGLKRKWITSDTVISLIFISINLLFGFSLLSFTIILIISLVFSLFKYQKTSKIIKDLRASI